MSELDVIRAIHLNSQVFKQTEFEANRVGFGIGLAEAGKLNKNIVALCCDLKESTRMIDFEAVYPDRYIEIGVAEQNMAGIAAGMALAGKVPFMVSYAAFSPGRNFDQIRVAVAYSDTNVKIIGAHAGLSVGPDGATHQMLEDIALMRALPNMVVIAPADYDQARLATLAAAQYTGPVYIRLAREKVAKITTKDTPFEIGKANIISIGSDITLISTGPMLLEVLKAGQQLVSTGVSVEIIDCHTIKPLDVKTIGGSLKKTGAVITAEEAQITGGLGGAVAELIAETVPAWQERIGVKDSFGETGNAVELAKKYGLLASDIVVAARRVLKRKNA